MPTTTTLAPAELARFVRVRGARTHNLKNVDVDVPRDALVVFSGVSGSGKSSLAFGTIYAEAQRRYLDSIAPYARRLIDQVGVPDIDSIDGLPPRGGFAAAARHSERALVGRQPDHAVELAANALLAGRHLPSLTIRQRAIAAWPTAWGGQNLRDILVSMGIDVDRPWRDLPKKDREWILFSEEHPQVPVYAGFTPAETKKARRNKLEPSDQGTFTGAKKYVLQTFAKGRRAAHRQRRARAGHDVDAAGVGVPVARTQHTDPLAG